MAFTWKLSEIRDRWREVTGLSTTDDISDSDINDWINDYYQNYFPDDAKVDELNTFLTQDTSVADNGEYSLDNSDIKIGNPCFCDNQEIDFIQDYKRFFALYPENEQFISNPTLVIGSTATKVGFSAFTYKINGYAYSKSAGEITLSGDTIPQNLYGAYGFKIDVDGTIELVEATDNATGYATPAKAVEDLEQADSDSVYIGYITVKSTDSGGFIPGTTSLSDSAVTDTYTDGDPNLRAIPEAICVYGGKLYVRPKANDIFRLKFMDMSRPDAFSSDSSVPPDSKWGLAIALGSAILYINQKLKDDNLLNTILPSFQAVMNSIKNKKIMQRTERKVQRSF